MASQVKSPKSVILDHNKALQTVALIQIQNSTGRGDIFVVQEVVSYFVFCSFDAVSQGEKSPPKSR